MTYDDVDQWLFTRQYAYWLIVYIPADRWRAARQAAKHRDYYYATLYTCNWVIGKGRP